MGESSGPHPGEVIADVTTLLPSRMAAPARFEVPPVVRDRLPLPGGCVLTVLETGDQVVVTPIVPGHGTHRRAAPGDGAFAGIVTLVRAGEVVGRFVPRSIRDLPDVQEERGIEVDQSNDSVVVGERVVVKLYPRTAAGPQPGVELPAHLHAVGFEDTPGAYGSLVWTSPEGAPVLLATVAAYLPGATDGWDWFLRSVLDAVDGGDREPALAPADRCGSLVARLHAALATPSDVLGDVPVRDASPDEVAGWQQRALATLDDAIALTGGDEGRRLEGMAPAIRVALQDIAAIGATPTMRIHGDLHVGQILSWEGGLAVSDFDGNPLAPVAVRLARQPPARDVASFVRSLDHLGRIVQRRRTGRERVVEAWIGEARLRFLAAYRASLGELGHARLFDEQLLHPFEVAQECHEYVYAARFLPRWGYVPDLAMPRLLEVVGP
jgi:maltokinase